jgi:hypothetical protein
MERDDGDYDKLRSDLAASGGSIDDKSEKYINSHCRRYIRPKGDIVKALNDMKERFKESADDNGNFLFTGPRADNARSASVISY